MKSIKTKLIIYFTAMIIVLSASLSVYSYTKTGGALKQQAYEGLEGVSQETAKVIESRIQGRFLFLETVANRAVIRGKFGDVEATWEDKKKSLQDEQKRGGFVYMGIADLQGNLLTTTGRKLNISDREYFSAAVKGNNAISDPLISKEDNKTLIIAFAVPVRDFEDKISGALIGVVDAQKFNNIIKDITYGESGYAFVLNKAGTTIAHPDEKLLLSQDNDFENVKKDKNLESLVKLEERMVKGEKGFGTYTYKGTSKLMGFAPVKETRWAVAVVAPQDEILKEVHTLMTSMVIITIVLVLGASLLTFLLAHQISHPLTLAVKHLQAIASGNYTIPVPVKFMKMKDEVGRLAKGVHELQTKVKTTLLSVNTSAVWLQEQSEGLSAAAEEMAATTGQVADSIQEVAKGSSQQAQDVQETVDLLAGVSKNMEYIYEQLKHLKESTQITTKKAKEGKKEIDVLINSIENIKHAFVDVTEKIQGLLGSVGQIGRITQAINAIAEQTNLLALNAAIEAARAGEAGKGFAVVSDEIRKLAEQSKASASEINKLVGAVTEETGNVASTAKAVEGFVEAQAGTVSNTIRSFDHIIGSIEEVAPLIEQTYEAVDRTVKSRELLQDKISNVSSVVEETSASTQEIAASSEEVSASTQEVASTAQNLNSTAIELMDKIKQFKLE